LAHQTAKAFRDILAADSEVVEKGHDLPCCGEPNGCLGVLTASMPFNTSQYSCRMAASACAKILRMRVGVQRHICNPDV
jgi:hypothetical protein